MPGSWKALVGRPAVPPFQMLVAPCLIEKAQEGNVSVCKRRERHVLAADPRPARVIKDFAWPMNPSTSGYPRFDVLDQITDADPAWDFTPV